MIAIADTQTKTCPDCQCILPMDAFRLRKQGSDLRQGICRRCYNARMRLYRRAKRSKIIRRFAAQLRRESDWRKVTALCRRMFNRFGGLDGFGRAWGEEIDHARRNAHGSKRVLDSLFAVIRLVEIADAKQRADSDLSDISDAELQKRIAEWVTSAAARLVKGLR